MLATAPVPRAARYENAMSKRPKVSNNHSQIPDTNFRDRLHAHEAYSHIKLHCSSYLLQFPAHLKRAFSSVVRDIASPEEKTHLASLSLNYKGTTNLLVWRRSTFVLLILSALVTLSFQTAATVRDWGDYQHTLAVGAENVTYGARKNDTINFRGFTERLTKSALSSALRDVKHAQFWIQIATVGLTIVALLAIVLAQWTWAKYKTSRKLMLVAWLFAFAVPFAVSAAPTRTLINWDRFDNQTNSFITGFALHFKMDAKAAQITSGCTELTSPNNENSLATSRAQLSRLCSMIPDNAVGNFLSGGKANKAKQQCVQVKALLNDGKVDQALATGKEMCGEVLDAISTLGTENEKDLEFVQVASDLMVKAKLGAELGISLYTALWAVKAMLPAAVALAPALMRGALKIKVLIPQSSIPGMLVVLLPWLYCPMLWIVYSVVFQMVGDMVLFVGLAILAFAPLFTHFGLGMCLHVPKPTDDSRILFIVRVMSVASSILSLVSLTMIGYFVFGRKGDHQGIANDVMRNLLNDPSKMVGILAATMFKWFVTTIAGVDFVVGEIAAQRSYEIYLETGSTERGVAGIKKVWNMGQEERLKIKGMMNDRDERLDDVCRALRV